MYFRILVEEEEEEEEVRPITIIMQQACGLITVHGVMNSGTASTEVSQSIM